MSLRQSTIIYTIANGVMALFGLALTLALGRQLGQDEFGVWASFFSAQNIWAGLGFMRLETRLATCKSIYQADRIIYAGFLVGLLVSLLLSIFIFIFEKFDSFYWLAILSGFGLSIFDVISQRKAYEGKQFEVLTARCARALLPVLVAVGAAQAGLSVTHIIAWQSGVGIILALIVWGRWMALRRWWRLCIRVIRQHKHGLVPTVIMSLMNGVWINGMTPALNHFVSSALAGQFAMVQRLVGGALGLLSTAITLGMLKRDYVEVHWSIIRKVLTVNVIISISLCMLLANPLISDASHWLGVNWTVDSAVYWATCAFLVSSFSIGAISLIAIRLHDEWYLVIWQFAAILCWLVIFMIMPPGEFLIPALWFGSGLYVLLGLRWRHLASANRNND